MKLRHGIKACIGLLMLMVAATGVIGSNAWADSGPHKVPYDRGNDEPISLEGLNETVEKAGGYGAALVANEMRQAQAEAERQAQEAARQEEANRAPKSVAGPAPRSGGSSDSRCAYANEIIASGLPEYMVGIAWRESNCIPDVSSGTGCMGLFQICWPLHQDIEIAQCGRSDQAGMYDPICNIKMAYNMWRGGQETGNDPWHL